MARQRKFRSINNATEATSGGVCESGGHNSIGLFVVAHNLDTANDSLEVVIDAGHTDDKDDVIEYAGPTLKSGTGPGDTQRLGLNETDLEDADNDGSYAGFVYGHGIPLEFARARITSFTDAAGSDLEVDVWVYFGNWTGPGREHRRIL